MWKQPKCHQQMREDKEAVVCYFALILMVLCSLACQPFWIHTVHLFECLFWNDFLFTKKVASILQSICWNPSPSWFNYPNQEINLQMMTASQSQALFKVSQFVLQCRLMVPRSHIAFRCEGANLMCSSIHGIFQARILAWVAIPFSKGSSQPKDQTQVSCIEGRLFTTGATREAI